MYLSMRDGRDRRKIQATLMKFFFHSFASVKKNKYLPQSSRLYEIFYIIYSKNVEVTFFSGTYMCKFFEKMS